MRRGQASTEYLVILAVVIIIALVVVAVLGGFIDVGTSASQQSSKAYWRTADMGILDWTQSGNDFKAVIRNNQDYRINVNNVTVGGELADVASAVLTPGATTSVNATISCTAGSSYAHEIVFNYDNLDYNIDDKKFTGTQKLVGTC